MTLSRETFEHYGSRTLAALARAIGMGDQVDHMLAVLRHMLSPWGSWEIGDRPRWHSDVCADGSPLEFSLAIDGEQPEIRVLTEALAPFPTLEAMQDEARALIRTLVTRCGAGDARLRMIEDLFLPPEPQGGYAMMHAAMFRPNRPNDFKIYLNPEADGEDRSAALVHEALARLGFERAWRSVERYAWRGFEHDRLVYLSLDLASGPEARVKVYFRHYAMAPAALDQSMEIARGHTCGHAEDFCRDVTGHEGAFVSQPLVSCLSFTDPDDTRPAAATLYVPLWTYASDDEVTRARIRACLRSRGLPVGLYDAALAAVARRPLDEANGIHTYVSLRTRGGRPRITTYWSSELYDRRPPPRYQREQPARGHDIRIEGFRGYLVS